MVIKKRKGGGTVVSVFNRSKLPKKPDIERNRELREFCLEILGFYFRYKTGLSCVEYLVVNVLLNGPAGPSDITWFYKKLGLKISPRTVRRVIHDLRIKGLVRRAGDSYALKLEEW